MAHNDPSNYEVAQLERNLSGFSGVYKKGDWIVRRRCRCHSGEPVSISFTTKAAASRCLAAIAVDWQRYGNKGDQHG
jgi:hypothetical protein